VSAEESRSFASLRMIVGFAQDDKATTNE